MTYCDKCDKTFSRKDSLIRHKRYACNENKKRKFESSNTIRKTNREERLKRCEGCDLADLNNFFPFL